MFKLKSAALRGAALPLVLALAGCTSAPQRSREPANLYPHKLQLRAYVATGEYHREIADVAAAAEAWVTRRVTQGGAKLTMVFDLDETLFENWPHISGNDFGWIPELWDEWVDSAKAPPIESVRRLYHTARRHGVEVVFLTGRRERERAATERNLRAMGCAEHVGLICKPDGDRRTSAEFKTAERRRLTAEGRVIIANVGDQASDLSGGFAERVFKIPNPFYLTE